MKLFLKIIIAILIGQMQQMCYQGWYISMFEFKNPDNYRFEFFYQGLN